ncbi:T9SS C-terminal target domain-containing protein [Dokdonia sinensis]|uniref:T9SS C-terminal target domain-containing protein n=1 Tax=Dokdonia sinensis TaxID=2479847 RepID=A0A3M0GL75_9FLAO|nr:T9SS type A sorting domain-containing protein [Dokdonia sinensis]RMB58046.1 T9SS C-terminal target domain-containing protein [Dokdonia sinensis]
MASKITLQRSLFCLLSLITFLLSAQNPTAVCQDITVQLDGTGVVMITGADVDGGSTDDMGIVMMTVSPDAFSCGDIGMQSVTLTVEDADGNMDSCTAIVTVEDTMPPTAVCQDITVQLDATGNVSITPDMLDGGSSDNCVALSFGASQTDFDCTDIGTNNVTLTVTDIAGQSATCIAVVTVQDMMAPTAMCQNIVLPIDVGGNAVLDPSLLDGGSTDNCAGPLTFSASQTMFTCGDTGPQMVTLTVTDASGNSDTCVATVTIQDTAPPVIMCQNLTRTLDASGNLTIDPVDFDNGTTDNCGNVTFTASQTMFSCDDVLNPPTNDLLISGVVYGSLIEFVDDDNDPGTPDIEVVSFYRAVEVFALRDIVNLSQYGIGVANDGQGSDGQEFIFPAIPIPAGMHLTISDESTVDLNTNYFQFFDNTPDFEFSGLDIDGNDAIELYFNNNVIDTFGELTYSSPTEMDPLLWDYELGWAYRIGDTGPDGNTFIGDSWFYSTPGALNGEDTNATALAPFPLDVYNFIQAGSATPVEVTVTATDDAGNSSTCTATVTVEDTTPPIALSQDLVVQLSDNGEYFVDVDVLDTGSSDTCGIASRVAEPSAFFCDEVGDNIVTLTVTDVFDNVSTSTSTITVQDVTPPVMVCEDITVQLDASGTITITPDQIGSGSSDICGFDEMDLNARTIDVDTFDCSNVGMTNIVTYTAIDVNGNSNTCTAMVTVEDNISPEAICQDITIQLDASGNATLTAIEIDGGSTDACGIASRAVDITTFTCANIGENNVELTITDVNGNSSTCTAVVTVEDTVNPTAIAMDITVGIGTSGSVTVSGNQLNNGSSDNCAIASFSVSPNTFTCADVGAPVPVTLTVTDTSGNSSTTTANITLVDNVPPSAVCQNVTLELDSTGNIILDVDDIDNGSAAACGGITRSIDVSSFDCTNIGANNVTLTVTNYNNVSTQCTAVVTVQDNSAPVVICQDLNVLLDSSGNATITAGDVDNGSTDNCGIATVAIDTTTFDCSNVGANNVTLTVTDVNGNSASCIAVVTVADNISPVAVCQNITVQLDVNGSVTIDAMQVDGGSSDFCGVTSRSLDVSTFDCSDIGANTVILTVTDASGNMATCQAIVTVVDNQAPTAVCKNITVQLDASGSAFIAPEDIDDGSTDACGVANLEISNNLFTCNDVGSNNVILTVTDTNGNSSTCSAIVTVEDTVAPTVICQDITINLDAGGSAFITVNDIDGGSSDSCGVSTTSIDTTTFDCDNIGVNSVELTVTDINGNTATCIATVTVIDDLDPTIDCPTVLSVGLEGASMYTVQNFLTSGQIGVSDNCGADVVFVSQIPTVGTVLTEGIYDGTLTIEDASGNQESCFFDYNVTSDILTTDDAIAPTSVLIYPVPATSVLTVENKGNLPLETMTFYDMLGRKVKTVSLQNMGSALQVDVSAFAKANYLIIIAGPEGITTRQFIKE